MPRRLTAALVLTCALLLFGVPTAGTAARVVDSAVPSKARTASVAARAATVLLDVLRTATQPARVPRRLDGVFAKPKQANRLPVAVMIDNIPAARPQAGLSKASVVYEVLAEGGIPRFMAVFATRNVPLIGPIRSARPYFVRYAAEYPAALVHAGGSPDAQNLLKKLRLVNMEVIRGPFAKFFLRRGRYAGLYAYFTSGDLLTKALRRVSLERSAPRYSPWRFSTREPPLHRRPAGTHGAAVNLGAGTAFSVRYEYDRARNVYLRFTGGMPHRDRNTGEQITVKNVILLVTPKEKVLDAKGRIAINNVGIDKGVLLRDGKAMTIRWVKRSVRGRTTFRTLDGTAAALNRGATWITVVPRGHGFRLF